MRPELKRSRPDAQRQLARLHRSASSGTGTSYIAALRTAVLDIVAVALGGDFDSPEKETCRSSEGVGRGVSMTWAAGYIDVVAYLVWYHVYVSHMTGNTASFAHDFASGDWAEAFRHGWPILPFTGGLLYSAASTKLARRRGFHSSFSIALITEIVLLKYPVCRQPLSGETARSCCYPFRQLPWECRQ